MISAPEHGDGNARSTRSQSHSPDDSRTTDKAPSYTKFLTRSTQYISTEFTDVLAKHEMIQSLSRPGQCWDNAVAETFFASLKLECIYRRSWATRSQARRAVFDYIEVFFNRRRLHSTLGYMTPAAYEAKICNHKAAPAA